jgi:hypothetical protein
MKNLTDYKENLMNINFKEPEIIALEKLKPITKNIVINKQNYSKLHDGNIYVLYLKKNPIRNE